MAHVLPASRREQNRSGRRHPGWSRSTTLVSKGRNMGAVYDTDEATTILRALRNDLSLSAKEAIRKARATAAERLVAETKALLSANGFDVTEEGEFVKIRLPPTETVLMHCDDGIISVISVHSDGGDFISRHRPEIDFDPASGKFEGRAEDQRFVPVPGQPASRRRGALAVMAQLVDKAMREGAGR